MATDPKKIIRTPTQVAGGITAEEEVALAAHAELWIARAMRTEPINPDLIIPAIEGIYKASNLKVPRVVIVPSPIVMAAAYGAAAAIWHQRKNGDESNSDVLNKPMTQLPDDATPAQQAMQTCFDISGELGVACAQRWSNVYQGGNMWAGNAAYLTAMRDILGLRLPSHEAYKFWEDAAIHGGFRVMHEEFCLVCDFPQILTKDENNLPHNETGPSHRWSDGFEIHHWHGVPVPKNWIEDRANIDPKEVILVENVEERAVGAALCGWPKMLSVLESKIIDDSGSEDIGQLIELTLPGLPEPGRFLKARCPRNGLIVEGVPHVSDIDNLPINTALAAQAWRIGDPLSEYEHPQRRT